MKQVRLNLGKILKDKNPKLAKWIPRFVVRGLNNFIKADSLNEILELNEFKDSIGFIDGALDYIGVTYKLYNIENIPSDSKLIFIANHPLGGVDGMILATAIDKVCPDVRLIVNDILLNIEPLKPIFVGVNKHGAQANELSQKLNELYNSNSPIINFPAGLCSRLFKKGVINDLQWKPSFVARTIASQRVVIPTFVEARNSRFFYKFARWRKRLGIKANLEMVMLPRQVFFQKGKEVKIHFGKPITMDSSRSARKWCNLIREEVYKLGSVTLKTNNIKTIESNNSKS